MHIPHNFGHTVEMVAAFGSGPSAKIKFRTAIAMNREFMRDFKEGPIMPQLYQHNQSVWGGLDENLAVKSNVNCTMYLTPPKYWPDDLAKQYFGDKKVFGILRDPYERLVTYFRSAVADDSGDESIGNYSYWAKKCDVNGAVYHMMKYYLRVKNRNPYIRDCAFLPQAEYFDGKYGIKIAVDNRKFPMSMNRVFDDHGYNNMHIETADCLRAQGCNEIWAGTLAPATRKLIQEVYAKDFELLCSKFGYCNKEENTCVDSVYSMCPKNMTKV